MFFNIQWVSFKTLILKIEFCFRKWKNRVCRIERKQFTSGSSITNCLQNELLTFLIVTLFVLKNYKFLKAFSKWNIVETFLENLLPFFINKVKIRHRIPLFWMSYECYNDTSGSSVAVNLVDLMVSF